MKRFQHPVTALVCLLGFAVVEPVNAAVQTTSFGVTVRVVARTRLEVLDAPASIQVSTEDLARGYKDVDARYRVHVSRMTPYVLKLAPRVGLAEAVQVAGLGAAVMLGSDEIEVLRPAAASASDLNLRLRLLLRPGLPAGAYELPLQLSVSPL